MLHVSTYTKYAAACERIEAEATIPLITPYEVFVSGVPILNNTVDH